MAAYISFYSKTPNPKHLHEAAEVLHGGGIVIFPTDTVYGLGCLSSSVKGLERFAKIKESGTRERTIPLSVIT